MQEKDILLVPLGKKYIIKYSLFKISFLQLDKSTSVYI